MEFLKKVIDFLTDPSGLGFPLLIATGLGAILYLMKYSTKEWRKEEKKMKEQETKFKGPTFPFKPF